MSAVTADTFTVFKPVILFIKCFGLAPYSVSGKLGSRLLRTSFIDVLYSVVFIIVSSFLVMYQPSFWYILKGVSICSVSGRVITFGTIIQFVLSAFVCLLKRHKIVHIANQLASLNASLKRSCVCVWKRICRILLSHLFISLLSVISCFVSDVLARIQDPPSMSYITFIILSFASFLVEFQIVCFLMLLKQLISDLNNSVRDLGRVKGNKDDTCSCPKTSPLNSTAPVFVSSAYEKLRNNGADTSGSEFRDTKVVFLRDIQDSLCATSEKLNSVYSFLLLYTSAKTFICLTHNLYFIIIHLFTNHSKTCGLGSPYSNYMWFLHYAIKLVWLVYYSSSTIQQANHTAVLVHKLITKTRDSGLREELRLFSLQLLHRKVKFTACGFFPLDFTLLYSIVGAVTTYLVILIQFRLSLPKSEQNGTTIAGTHWVGVTTPTIFTTTVLPQ
ncbi:putative gustatory receptor 28a [Cryptotermes secundus]|uniref:putative gustatory receptor 28a n=1 Tax=Cryptotermes secundus TaxID=105785 RepID=UPI001454CBA2|nr:putative gustatory receptor 28a [Cryptotermes secundus]